MSSELGLYWSETPRCFGNPLQIMVYDKRYLNKLIAKNDGQAPCFISHNSFPELTQFEYPKTVRVSKIFKDFDHKSKPENAQLDARNLLRFCEEINHPIAVSFSANKGFHGFPLFKPENYPVNSKLKEMLRAVQLFFRGLGEEDPKNQEYKCKLRTDDIQVMGDERRLCRVWGTQYVNDKGLTLDTHCCSLEPDMVLDWDINKIKEYSLNPEPIKFDWKGKNCLTLKEFIKKYKIKRTDYINKPEGGEDGTIAEYKGVAEEFIQRLFIKFPCLAEGISQESPKHPARFGAVAWLKHIGMKQDEVISLFRSRNWIDSSGMTVYQVKHIFSRDYPYPGCRWLRMKGVCIGREKCNEIKKRLRM